MYSMSTEQGTLWVNILIALPKESNLNRDSN